MQYDEGGASELEHRKIPYLMFEAPSDSLVPKIEGSFSHSAGTLRYAGGLNMHAENTKQNYDVVSIKIICKVRKAM